MSVRSVVRSFAVAGCLIASATAFFPPVSLLGAPPSPLGPPPPGVAPTPRRTAPSAALDTAITRMGGEDVLRKIERVRFEMMTLWQRMSFENRPTDLIGSYELHTDLRNYALGTWRNTRRFVGGPTLREMTDIVQRDAAIRRFPVNPDGSLTPWAPLNTAYVDERKELFAFAPERVLLSARAAGDLRPLADTTISGIPHARVGATVDGFPATIFLRRNDGFLAMARYRAAQPNDFGLAPWGTMEVEVWYSRWNKFPVPTTQGVGYPTQWDIRRVGRLYKRLTVLAANFDAAAPADSFAISDSLRSAFASGSSSRAMWDVPMDSAKILEPRLARLGTVGQTQAVKIGSSWLLLEGAGVPQRNATEVQWLQGADAGSTIGGLLISVPNFGRGSAAWFAEKKLPVYVAPGAGEATAATLANWKQAASVATVVSKARWVKMGGDSLWIETIDYPDMAGAVVAYVPSMRWAYSGAAASTLNFDLLVARIRARGWDVDRVGSLRSLAQPVPGRTASR